jgi:hypothetical protein
MTTNLDIYVMGKRYQVPEGLTILTAMEYCGYRMIRGCGCRAGFCGACATIYRTKDDPQLRFDLPEVVDSTAQAPSLRPKRSMNWRILRRAASRTVPDLVKCSAACAESVLRTLRHVNVYVCVGDIEKQTNRSTV